MKMTLNEEIEYLKSGNWYDKVRAVLPTDEYLKLGWAIGDILETLELFRSLVPEPQTNADRIRSMSDEKLASEMTQRSISTICDIVCQGGCEAIATLNKTGGEVCKEIIMKWLQQPAEEEDT